MVAGLISGNIHFMYLAVSFLVSVAGDYFLSYKNRDKNYFVYGIALYFLAHIGYLLYIVMSFDVNIIVFLVAAALLLGGYLAYYFIALVKNIKGVMSVAVLAYLVISCAVLGFGDICTSCSLYKNAYGSRDSAYSDIPIRSSQKSIF